jgi:hypothetical protein
MLNNDLILQRDVLPPFCPSEQPLAFPTPMAHGRGRGHGRGGGRGAPFGAMEDPAPEEPTLGAGATRQPRGGAPPPLSLPQLAEVMDH